jgi:hypothetical protein
MMQGSDRQFGVAMRRLTRQSLLLAIGAGVLSLTLCAGTPARADDDDDDSSWTDKIGDGIKNTFTSAGKAVGLGSKPEGPPARESPSGCPTIAVLDGTAGSRVMAANGAGNQGVRYQFSLGDVGRQCSVGGGRASIKVGASGRVLLGPAGAPGTFDVPIRVVVYSELQQKPVTSKLYRVPASVPAGRSSAPFQFVSDDIVVPTSGNAAAEYSIKIGLDSGKGGNDTAPAKKRSRHARQPVASTSQ